MSLATGITRLCPMVAFRKTPAPRSRPPGVTTEDQHILTEEQVLLLADACGSYRPLVLTSAYGGLRWAEAVGLKKGRQLPTLPHRRLRDALRGREHVSRRFPPRATAKRDVVVPRWVMEELAPLLEGDPDELVFTSPKGYPLRSCSFYKGTWGRAKRALGDKIPAGIKFHRLRHTCASLLIKKGATVKQVQVQLGHSNPAITPNIYTHLFGDDQDSLWDAVSPRQVPGPVQLDEKRRERGL
jgi:integrase